MPHRLSLQDVRSLAEAALKGCGTAHENATPVADSIRDAEADGIRNVGLGFLPIYCEHLLVGKVDGKAKATASKTAPGAMLIDARHGFCHPAFERFRFDFDEMVKRQGIAIMTITHSYTAGVLGWFAERLAGSGWVAMAFANASPAMAPWGGSKPFFGTNPLAFGVPRRDAVPLVIDQSSTMTAMVNVIRAAGLGQPIPKGWALDANGHPTTDAVLGMAGSMAPAGDYKGAALALMVDILAGGIPSAHFSYQASSLIDNEGGPPGVGQTFIAIDPARFSPDFCERVEGLLSAMLEQPGVRLPGDKRIAERLRARREGITLDDDLAETLHSYCQ